MMSDSRRVTIRAASHAPPDLRPLWQADLGSVPISVVSWHDERAPRRMTLLLGTVPYVVLGVHALVWTVVIDPPAAAQSNP
jgi:hypothetical protein